MTDNLLNKFQEFIRKEALFGDSDTLLVGCSGGVDSMVLVHLLLEAGYSIELAHLHFHLRGEESDGDAGFVRDFAKAHDLVYHQLDVDTEAYAKKHKVSIQEAARQLRYDWFEKIRKERQAQWIAVAHQKNDIAETMLFNLTRGTGIAGMHGIKSKNGVIVRPLLFAERAQLLAYAERHEIVWREDSSNQKTKYSRNLIRHKVLPLLAEINPAVIQNLAHHALIMSDLERVLDSYLGDVKKHLVTVDAGQVRIQLAQISGLTSAKTILYYLIRDYGFNESDAADILASRTSGKVFLSKEKRAVIHGEWLLITDFAEGIAPSYYLESWATEPIETPEFTLSWQVIDYYGQRIPDDANRIWLSKDKLIFPLTLRKRQPGDRFHPFGMGGQSKKLKDFLSNLKLSLPEKEKIWILESADGQICWVIGYRMDERFRVDAQTRAVLELNVAPKSK